MKANELLRKGINDGTYADILDTINVDTETTFFKAVCGFAEDFLSESLSAKPYSAEFINLLLTNAIRGLTEEQQTVLTKSLYERLSKENQQKVIIQ